MSRLLQVVIALVGLAITGVLGLASERSEALQSRHALIGLFTETVSAARSNCDQGLAAMAVGALQQLESLEANRFVLTPGDREDQEKTQVLLANYQDYMAEVQGTIDAGGCRGGGAMLASAEPGVPAGAGGGAASGASASLPPAVLAQVQRYESNMVLRQAEQEVQMADQVQQAPAQPASPTDDARPAPSAGEETAIERARVQLRLPVSGYYAVLASYPVADDATFDSDRGVVAHYRRLRQATREDGLTVAIFQTGATNLYAIVLTADGASRTDARRLVATARARGWSSGALVQPARDWTQCTAPERITRQGGCAGN